VSIPVAPAITYFTDSVLEIKGVARTSRKLEEFVRRASLPFLSAMNHKEVA